MTEYIRELFERVGKKEAPLMDYRIFTSLDTESGWYKGMRALHDQIFRSQGSGSITRELASKSRFLIALAMDGEHVVGYKIGYEERQHRFYSWLGGVHPNYRGQGIASALMNEQHEWCRGNGYTVIRTHTKNKWRSMLILNLRHGFDVIGTFTDEQGEPKIILEKRLVQSE